MREVASASSIAQSGMTAALRHLDSAAHNIANVQTEPFRRQQTVQTEQQGGGVTTQFQRASKEGPALEADVVNQLQAKNSFLANLAVFKTQDRMAGRLLDESA